MSSDVFTSQPSRFRLLGTRHGCVLFCAFHVPGCRARPANFQCDSRGWKLWGLPESRFWPLGVGVSSPRDAGRLCRTAILHVHWNRVADACGKGPGAPSVGQSYLAIHATSSWGCLVFDVIIAIWFLAGAPALVGHGTKSPADGVRLSGRLATVGTEWKSSCRSHINGRAQR